MSTTDTQTLVGSPDPQYAVRALVRDAHRRAQGAELRAELARIGATLERPLQLAVAGAVSAGKSTLINAVLGRPVAPADAGECTRIVTWYEFGEDDGAVIVERGDAAPLHRRLVDGRLPADLGCPVEDVARLRVQLTEPWLREVTVIDTPGMNTVRAENEAATRRLLFGDAAAEHAQALLYVLRHVQRFDADTLAEFRALSGAAGMTAVNTAAVLSHVDRFADEPWADAHRLCERAAAALQGSVLDVAPVAGLLAETGRGRLLGATELAALRALSELDDVLLDDELLDLDEFAGAPGEQPVRRTLVERLHRYGIRVAVEHLRAHPDAGLDDLHHALTAHSGYGGSARPGPGAPSTTAEIVDRFTRHSRRLKAYGAMARIHRIGRIPAPEQDTAVVRELQDAVTEGRQLAAGLGALRILAAGSALSRGRLRLNADMSAELMRMVREDDAAAQMGLAPGSPPSEIAERAREASVRWRRVALRAGPTVGGHRAHDVLDVLESMVASLTEASSADRERRPVEADARTGRDPGGPAANGKRPDGPTPDGPGRHRRDPPDGRRPDGPAPDVAPLDDPLTTEAGAARLTRLAAARSVSAAEREALATLAAARTVPAAVGLEPAAGPEAVRDAATALARRFRVLVNRPLPPPDKATARDVCFLYESIAQPGPPPATAHRSIP